MGTVLLIIALILGFYVAWNIGANDVANAMGTSVGSGALTLTKAVVLAAILEFLGAFFLGSHVSATIETGVIDPTQYAGDPRPYILGMLASLLAVGVWLQIASAFGWPVSTTHTIVGAIAGFGIITVGIGAIEWATLGAIVASWVISPLLGGCISFLVFNQIRKRIFYASEPVAAAKRLTPVLVFLMFTVLSLVLLFRRIEVLDRELPFWEALGYSVGIGIVAALISLLFLRLVPPLPPLLFESPESSSTPPEEGGSAFERLPGRIHYEALELHLRTVERIFVVLQVLSACFMAFAHGSNDVANAMGPLAGIIRVLQTGMIIKGAPVPAWILALGGIGIVTGIATWGWRVIATIGKKITELTPTRGFAAEFSAATTVVIASRLGLPISTTHTLVGAVLGVGLARGIGALNLHVIRDIVISWVVTVPAGALFSILFYQILRLIFA